MTADQRQQKTAARRLDMADPATLQDLWELQRAAYAVEAELIGFDWHCGHLPTRGPSSCASPRHRHNAARQSRGRGTRRPDHRLHRNGEPPGNRALPATRIHSNRHARMT
jgi:hypothetical protein